MNIKLQTNEQLSTTVANGLAGVFVNGVSLSASLSSKADLTALQNCYTKSETSSSSEISNELKKYQLSGNYLSSNALANYYQKSETSSANEISIALDNTGSKVYFDNRISSVTGSNDLSVVRLSADEYAQMLDNGTCLSNAIYIVEAPNIDAFKQQIKNVAPPTDLSDAATKGYVDDINNANLASSDISAEYKNQHIYLSAKGQIVGNIDCSDFIKDGMLSAVELCAGQMIFKFNTDAGAPPISAALSNFINENDYWKKTETSSATQLSTALLEKADVFSLWEAWEYQPYRSEDIVSHEGKLWKSKNINDLEPGHDNGSQWEEITIQSILANNYQIKGNYLTAVPTTYKTYDDTKSSLSNDGYLTAHQSLSNYYTKSETSSAVEVASTLSVKFNLSAAWPEWKNNESYDYKQIVSYNGSLWKANAPYPTGIPGSTGIDWISVDIKTVLTSGYQPKGNYLTAIPSDYKTYSNTITALTGTSGFKTYAQTKTALSTDGYATTSQVNTKSTVSFNRITTTGTNIGSITIDGTTTQIYAPTDGSGGSGSTVEVSADYQSGTKIATISVDSVPTSIYIPNSSSSSTRYALATATLQTAGNSLSCTVDDQTITTIQVSSSSTPIIVQLPAEQQDGARDFILRIEISSSAAPTFTFNGVNETIDFDSEDDDWAVLEPGLNLISFTETKRGDGSSSGNGGSSSYHIVTFYVNPEQGELNDSSEETRQVADGQAVGPLPSVSIFDGDVVDGWFTGQNGTGTQVTSSTIITADVTFYSYIHYFD